MRWLCLFFSCDWMHVANIVWMEGQKRAGLWQCPRCKTISIGALKPDAETHR